MSASRVSRAASADSHPSANGAITEDGPAKDKPAKPAESAGMIVVHPPKIEVVRIRIEGDSPLICSAFPAKLRVQMAEARLQPQRAKSRKDRPVRDFDQEFRNSLYPMDDGDGYGFPAIAFKHSIVGACRQVEKLAMTDANRMIFVLPEAESNGYGMVRIRGDAPTMREDMVRLLGPDKPADIRYRGEFKKWWCDLSIKYNADMISRSSLVNLIIIAGMSEGVGENRPSSPKKSGNHGTYHPVI